MVHFKKVEAAPQFCPNGACSGDRAPGALCDIRGVAFGALAQI